MMSRIPRLLKGKFVPPIEAMLIGAAMLAAEACFAGPRYVPAYSYAPSTYAYYPAPQPYYYYGNPGWRRHGDHDHARVRPVRPHPRPVLPRYDGHRDGTGHHR